MQLMYAKVGMQVIDKNNLKKVEICSIEKEDSPKFGFCTVEKVLAYDKSFSPWNKYLINVNDLEEI